MPKVSVHAPFLRRCFSNQNIYINACNENSATGIINNEYILLELDPLLIPDTSSIPYTEPGNNLYRFDVGNLNPGTCTKFSVSCSLSCDAILGQTLCMTASLLPADSCVYDTTIYVPTGVKPCTLPWDKSSLKVEASCADSAGITNVVRFLVNNTGEFGNGDMDCYSPVRVYVDAVMITLDSVKLNGGDSAVFVYPGDGRTWRLEADQHPLHPGHSRPNATIENCGTTVNWTQGLVNALPMDDADPFVDIYCGQVLGSYDPNDKQGYPTGKGANKHIMPNQKIDYVIRFQNTGTDTAFTVVIRDTLDKALDIFSVVSGVSSNEYNFRIYGQRVLEWTFNNILLPDSNVNEPASHGFVTFTVNQTKDLANETVINNVADIYFDYNDPVRTNNVVYQVQDNVQDIITSTKTMKPQKTISIHHYPNPTGDRFIISMSNEKSAKVSFSMNDLLGKNVMQWSETVNAHYRSELNMKGLPSGVYFLKIQMDGRVEVMKVVKGN